MENDIQRINLEDYVQTGEGGTALTYNHKNGKTLAKLYSPGWAADTASREFRINQVVYEIGLPTPEPIRLITDGTRFDAEYELISPKRSFARIISQEPDQLVPLSERFARLARQIHEKPADTQRLPDMKEVVRAGIDNFENLPAAFKERFHRFLDLVPSAPTCLHGDLHIGNIITDGQRDLWIDVGDFAFGVPHWDLCLMYYSANLMTPERIENLFHVDQATMRAHWNAFAPVYYGTQDKDAIAAEVRKLYPFMATKIAFTISKIRGGKGTISEPMLQMFDKFLPQAGN